MFTMVDRNDFSNSKNTILASLPMISKYSNRDIVDLPYERLIFKMKSGTTRSD
jgi:uncharacterized protein (DUF3820 family)